MIYNLHHFVLTIIAIEINLSPYTLAPWTTSPEMPPEGTVKSCADWILYHQFTRDPIKNRELAFMRDRRYDTEVFFWAASYAYSLTELSQTSIFSPSEFCFNYRSDRGKQEYLALKDTKMTCEGWIKFYGFFWSKNYQHLNLSWAKHRVKNDDNFISIWAALYVLYITSDASNGNTVPAEFCLGLGKSLDSYKGNTYFLSFYETSMTCREWILVFEYTDDPKKNYEKALKLNEQFEDFICIWTKFYIRDLRDSILIRTPEEFCISINKPSTVKVSYFA